MNTQTVTWLLYAGGGLHAAFAVFHLGFWRIFKWKKDLASLAPLNRSIVPVLNICLVFVFVALAYISFAYAGDLIATPLGRAVTAATALFWVARLILQFVFFDGIKPVSLILNAAFVALILIYLSPLAAPLL